MLTTFRDKQKKILAQKVSLISAVFLSWTVAQGQTFQDTLKLKYCSCDSLKLPAYKGVRYYKMDKNISKCGYFENYKLIYGLSFVYDSTKKLIEIEKYYSGQKIGSCKTNLPQPNLTKTQSKSSETDSLKKTTVAPPDNSYNGTYKISRDKITFSDTTIYEIYDVYGNMQMNGKSKEINIQSLKKGYYYLNYGNKTTDFVKKK